MWLICDQVSVKNLSEIFTKNFPKKSKAKKIMTIENLKQQVENYKLGFITPLQMCITYNNFLAQFGAHKCVEDQITKLLAPLAEKFCFIIETKNSDNNMIENCFNASFTQSLISIEDMANELYGNIETVYNRMKKTGKLSHADRETISMLDTKLGDPKINDYLRKESMNDDLQYMLDCIFEMW